MLILKLGCGGKTFRLMSILQLKDWMRMTPKLVKEPQPTPKIEGYRRVPKVLDFGPRIFRDGTNRRSATEMEALTSLGVAFFSDLGYVAESGIS